jgi:hypothetical protein
MGRKKRSLPTVRHGEEYHFRPKFEDGNYLLVPRGRGRYANELSYGYLDSGWRTALEPFAPASRVLTDENWAAVEAVLERYIFNRASECGAYPWADAIGTLDRIAKAASDLLAACDGGVAVGFIWGRLEAVGDTSFTAFTRDEFYLLLSALNRRAHLLQAAMKAERKRGDQLRVSAFLHFVSDIAEVYRAMEGTVSVSKISGGNKDVARPSKFSVFALEAMKQVPPELRQHHSSLGAFSDALDQSLGALRKNTKRINPYRSDERLR